MISHGFSARHWQQIESGRPITLRTLVKAAMVFEVRPSVLIRAAEGELPSAPADQAPSPPRRRA